MIEYKRVTFTQDFSILGEKRSAVDAAVHKCRITREGDRVFIESLQEARPEVYDLPASVCVLTREIAKKEKGSAK